MPYSGPNTELRNLPRGTGQIVRWDGTKWVASYSHAHVAILNSAAGSSNGALTASSTQEIMLSTGQRFQQDTAVYRQFRLVVNVSTGNANATVALQYSTTTNFAASAFANSGTSTAAAGEKLAIATANVPLDSGWVDLAAAAKADNLYWRLMTISGAATTAPVWKNVYVQYR